MILDVLRLEDEVMKLEGKNPGKGSINEAGGIGEIGRLKKELEKRDRDIEVMKSQSKGLSDEYNRLGDTFHTDGTPKKTK